MRRSTGRSRASADLNSPEEGQSSDGPDRNGRGGHIVPGRGAAGQATGQEKLSPGRAGRAAEEVPDEAGSPDAGEGLRSDPCPEGPARVGCEEGDRDGVDPGTTDEPRPGHDACQGDRKST